MIRNISEMVVTAVTVTSASANSLSVSWTSNGVGIVSYQVDYQLTSQDQCGPGGNRDHLGLPVTGNTLVASGLFVYSTYTIFVTPIGNSMCTVVERSQSARTNEAGR